MTNKKSIFKILLCGFLAIILSIPFDIGIISADTLTLADLLSEYSEQEITDTVLTNFSTDFGDISGSANIEGWGVPTYNKKDGVTSLLKNNTIPYGSNDQANPNTVSVVDLTETSTYYYGSTLIESALGTDTTVDNKYGLLFMTSSAGTLGIESSTFTIPANKIFVLTFSAKIFDVSNSKGLNAKIIDKTRDKTYTMAAIKTEKSSYTTYSFLIRGNEYASTSISLQLIWGNITEGTDENTASEELGYAVVDSIRLFNVTTAQYNDLASVTTTTAKADLYSSNQAYAGITNGNFSLSNINQLGTSTKINDFTPYNWTQETEITAEDNRIAHYGVIDVNTVNFTARKSQIGYNLVNPGFPVQNDKILNNNVLLLLNESSTWQTVTSGKSTLAKESYYEISFSFNTPSTSLENQTNSLSFYIVDDTDGTVIYKSEDMFSYLENTGSNNNWTTFKCFIKTSSTEEKVNFVIKFGTEDSTKSGYVYVDDVILTKKASSSTIFDNTLEDTYLLKTEEGEEAEYLAKGVASFSDLKKIDSSAVANRGISVYDYSDVVIDDEEEPEEDEEEEEEEEVEQGTSISYLWYVIPSILLGVCTILGLVIFYGGKLKGKIKLPKKSKKNVYDRKKTLEKQVSQREKAQIKNKVDAEKQLKAIRTEIEKLEANYAKTKKNPLALKEYVKRRETLQNRETKLLDIISKQKEN